MWVMNDEGMYNWFTSQRPRVGITTFIRNNRQEIDEAIEMYMRRSAENANRLGDENIRSMSKNDGERNDKGGFNQNVQKMVAIAGETTYILSIGMCHLMATVL